MSNIDTEDEIEHAAEKIMGILTRDEPRKSFDSYAHPDTKERAKKGISAILESAAVKDSLTTNIKPQPPSVVIKTCTQCGMQFTEYKHGNTRPNKCKDCLKSNIAESKRLKQLKKTFEQDADQYANEHPPVLTLTFNQKRDARVYEAICASAENDRRTPENQVLHFLEMALNGFASDVVFAMEETINREE